MFSYYLIIIKNDLLKIIHKFMKKKILLMENANHYHNVKSYYSIFKKKFEVSLYLAVNEDKKLIKLDCPEILNRKKFNIINAWSHKIFFLRSIFLNKFDYYFISYGLEQKKFYFILNYFFYLIFALIYKKKIIFRVGRSDLFFNNEEIKKLSFENPTIDHNSSIFSAMVEKLFRYIRIYSVKKSGYLSFESYTLKKIFKKFTSFPNKHLVIKPTSKKIINLEKYSYKSSLILGLHGALDPIRRDYDYLINELNKLNKKLKTKITIKFLGASNFISKKTLKNKRSLLQKNIISKIKNTGVKIISQNKGFIKKKEYEKLIYDVDFLIDIQKEDGHFYIKPTGLITDAQNYSKRILMKKSNDPFKEYEQMTIYYNQFSSCIKKIINKKNNLKENKVNILNDYEINKIII